MVARDSRPWIVLAGLLDLLRLLSARRRALGAVAVGLALSTVAYARLPGSGTPAVDRAHEAPGTARSGGDEDDDEDEDEDEDEDDEGDGGVADAAKSEVTSGSKGAGEDDDDDDEAFAVGADVDFVSRFVWRGAALSKRPVAEPEVWASYRSFTASVWSVLLLTAERQNPRFASMEVELGYKLAWMGLDIEPRVTRYWFYEQGGSDLTTEVGVDLKRVFGPWALISRHDVDVEGHPGGYYGTLGGRVTHTRGAWEGTIEADVAWATAAFNRAHWEKDVTTFDLVECSAEVRYTFTPQLSLALHGAVSTILSPALRAATSEPTLVWGGLAFYLDL